MWRLLIFTVTGGILIALKPTGIFNEFLKAAGSAIDKWIHGTRRIGVE
jgi:hypothetical protein